MKKILALILASLMLTSVLASCSDTTKDSESESKKDPAESDTQTPEEVGYYNSMEAVNMNGFEFRITGGLNPHDYLDHGVDYITIDAISGEDFPDALYTRAIDVGTKYNAKVTVTGGIGESAEKLKTSVTAGTKDYHMAYYYMSHGAQLAGGGYLYNLTEFPIDLELPFYDECSFDTFLINNRLFHLFSNITFSHYEAASVLFYNNKVLEDKNIKTDPYDLWKEGKWTLDAMTSLTEKASTDKDNNGKYTLNRDIVGFAGFTYRYIPVVLASGEDTVKWNAEEQTFDLNIASEAMINIGQQINAMVTSPWNDNSNTAETAQKAFAKNMLLFMSNSLGSFRLMRSNADPYAIMLWPSVEENTEINAHLRNPAPIGVASDLDAKEAEQVGTLMTALSAYCYDYILEDYVRLAVVARSSHDEKSAEVVRYIFTHRAYDTAECLELGAHHWWNGVVETGEYASTEKSQKGGFMSFTVPAALAPYYPTEE